jgi:serine/threonine-protein kinase
MRVPAPAALESDSTSQLALNPGARLGPYEIVALIGAGGMGEVYRARDPKLNRDVALKILPDAFAADPDRLARFKREAQVLASLNHPNIASIHGLEDSSGIHALVLELVDGPTLADRIAGGAMPIDEALKIAKQIAEALEAAHDQGIIHRDLKPANIKVRSDGAVKVLDFGLAKAIDPVASRVDVSQSPTITSPAMTQAGVILGTAAYMSPEQARGQILDKRADVWAFGCVLYEMLTNRAPFARETVSDSVAAILERDPDWAPLPSAAPATVRRLLARCLAKDRQQRLRDVGDARLEIDELLTSPTVSAPVVKASTSGTSRWLAPILVSTAAAVLVTWIVLSRYSSSQPSLPLPVLFTVAAPSGYEVDVSSFPVGVSRDGRTIAIVASHGGVQRIYLRDLDRIEATPLPGTEGGFAPFFSPDGQWVAFFANQKLRKVLRAGGAPVTIADFSEFAGNRSVAANWDDQDTIFFTPDVTKGIWRTSAAGGTPTAVTRPTAGESFHIWPQPLPGGKALLFTAVGDGPDPQAFVQRLDTGERKPLLRGVGTRYVPTGQLLFIQGGSLMAVPFDLARLEIGGPAVAIASHIAEPFRLRVTPNGFSPLFDVSPTGTIAFLSAEHSLRDALVWVDRSGRETPVGVTGGTYAQPRVSPDGRRIAVVVRGDDHDDIWLYDLGRNTLGRVTTEGNNGFPIWTRDGSRLVYSSDRTGTVSIESKRFDGAGVGELLVRSERASRAFPFSWSPDGELAFVSNRGTQHVWTLRPGQEATPFFMTPFIEGAPMFAPDGRAIAYVSNETGRNEIYIRAFSGPGEKLTVTNEGGNEPLWAPSGRELFYRNGDAIMAVDVTTSPTLKAGTPRKLFEKHYEPSLALFANYSISPDGQRFVMVKRISDGESPTEIKVAVNWFTELRQRLHTE